MEIKIKNYNPALFLQEGGEMIPPADGGTESAGAPAAAPAEGGGDPMQQLLMACQQAVESQDCNLAMQVCQALMQMAGGGGEPAPQEAPGEPVYRMGGKLSRWV